MVNFKIYVINLDNSIERWNNILYLSKKYKIDKNIARIGAINGSEIKYNNELLKIFDKNAIDKCNLNIRHKHSDFSWGSIGCFLSHVKCWKKILKNRDEYALILEDDVDIPLNLEQNIQKTINETSNDWNILNIGNYFIVDDTKSKNINTQLISTYAFGASAYIIKKNICSTLINSLDNIDLQVDHWLSSNRDVFRYYFLKNNIVSLNTYLSERSTIKHPHVINDNNKFFNSILVIFLIVLCILILLSIIIYRLIKYKKLN